MNSACHFNKQDTFKLLADVGPIFPEDQPAPIKMHFVNPPNWIPYSKHNGPEDKKQPLDAFVQSRTNRSNESSHNIDLRVHNLVSEFSLQTPDMSLQNTNNTTETKNTEENSPNSQNSTGAYIAEQNEFSDHSDAESFARLSESVFEAIEDTRDSIIDKHTTDDTRVLAKSGKSKQTRTCPICGKVYTASSSYFYHMKYFHRQSKEHSCDVCGKRFGTRGDLKQHAAVHSEECKYACRSCSKKFRSRASWYIHEQIHEGVKNYKCPTCEKCFRWRTHLQRHTLRHAAEKKHECGVCGRGFSVHCDLLRHARTHDVGSFECDECHVKFAQMRYLKAHIRKKHCVTANDKG